jgi:hypothetical protein
LKEEGFARLPRRGDDERPDQPHPLVADVADVRQLDLTPRHFRTKFGGLFLFLPWIVSADVMNRHDPGVTQLGKPARLLKELLRLGLRRFGAAPEHLDGDRPVELRVVARYTAPKPPDPRAFRT